MLWAKSHIQVSNKENLYNPSEKIILENILFSSVCESNTKNCFK